MAQAQVAQAQVQRPFRGSRISSFYPVKSLPSLSSLNSAFQLQEYISLLIRLDVHDVDAIVSVPGRGKQKEKEKEEDADESDGKEKAEVVVDEGCWKYEQLRRLAQDLSHPLITMLQQVCTRTTCPEMKAGEWLYLCVAHGNDGAMEQCCAIDYILHTLDSATALLNSPRAFPSRIQIPPASHRHFTSLARRLGRIFAHAYFHHREEFEQAEAESSLYARFLALTEKFDLVPADFLVIPPRAAAGSAASAGYHRRGGGGVGHAGDAPPPTLLSAALRVDTDTVAPAPRVDAAGRETSPSPSPSPPGLDDAAGAGAGPRRYGRSRTDTMMLEGDKDRDGHGRFPATPPVAPEDALGAVLATDLTEIELGAADAEKRVADVPAVAASPVPAPVPQEPGAAPELEHEHEHEHEPVPVPEDGREHEPESPTSDEEGAPLPRAGPGLPEVTPSSSTAPQAAAIHVDVEQEREDVPAPTPATAAAAGEAEADTDTGAAADADADARVLTVATDAQVPTISVEPATPPADGAEEEEEREMSAELVEGARDEGEGDAEEARVPAEALELKEEEEVAAAAGPTGPLETEEEVAQEDSTPAPAAEIPALSADKELDVADSDSQIGAGSDS
ncbi:Mob1/phocein [Mycena pura]|uniref:Mob1/phocein n=1 Tax=Mycena pura TaxID=153505 RepID=A0AAD6VEB3_9AGAR|nr:Mob1/phocein [Mycena pura]